MEDIRRAYILEWMWEKTEPVVFIDKDTFMRAYEDWDVYHVMDKGVFLGVVAEKGPEFHFQSTGKMIPRRVINGILQSLIDRHGCAVTKTPKLDTRQQRFNRLLGFEVTEEDEYDVYYRIDRVRGRPSA